MARNIGWHATVFHIQGVTKSFSIKGIRDQGRKKLPVKLILQSLKCSISGYSDKNSPITAEFEKNI